MVADEAHVAAWVDRVARNVDDFELIATAIETAELNGICLPKVDLVELDRFLDDERAALEGLEIGVAGLVYALAAIGAFPAASCRGHSGEHAWSDNPVVLFAADRVRAERLQPLVESSGCGFEIDAARPELLIIEAACITNAMSLAQLIFDNHGEFKPSRRTKTPTRNSEQRCEQICLFEASDKQAD